MNHGSEQRLVERRERGVIRHGTSPYGASVDGVPLTVYLPEEGSADLLVLAAIHGDEPETTIAVSEALRCIPRGDLRAAVILCANPDGMLRGTRGNARGVDLNRNFPTSNWSADPVFYKSRKADARDIALGTGAERGSESETRALVALIERLGPRAVVSLHSALACVDDAGSSPLGRELSRRCELPLVGDIGYATPGSMGSWAGERGLNLVTWELEDLSLYAVKDRNVPVLIDLLTGKVPLQG
ncbi:MAG TPA: murein tripeptide amidase MpaA [Thermoanaerobaculia bacterium]